MNEPDPYPRVFLNYATEDRGFAIKLVKQLEARGVNVWCDLSLPIGKSQSDRIPELISARDYLIMLIYSKYQEL